MRRYLSLARFACLCSIAVAPAQAFAGTPFVNEVVDLLSPPTTCTGLSVDAWGQPHAAYRDDDSRELRYAVKIGGRWRIETVPGTAGTMLNEVDLDVDSKGQPHILYWKTGNQVHHATKQDGVWFMEQISVSANVGRHLAVAVDGSDQVHAVYSQELTANRLLYRSGVAGNWGSEEVIDGSISSGGGYCGVETDSEGRPHVAYQGMIAAGTGLRYAVRNPGWSSVEADPADMGAIICSIALDAMGRPHISHWLSDAGELRHAYLLNGSWQQETVDGVGADYVTGAENDIAVDAKGGIHISYFENRRVPVTPQAPPTNNLRYAYQDGAGWNLQTVDETGIVGCYTNIALDGEGNPHIIHFDDSNFVLKYSTSAVRIVSPFGGEAWAGGAQQFIMWEGPGPVDIELSTDGGLTYETIALGIHAHRQPVTLPRVSTTAARVRVVRNTPYSTSSSPSPFSIAPDLVAPWWHVLVDSVGQTGTQCVLALDTHDNPRIVYVAPTGLRYAARSGDGWFFETIAASAGNASLALERDGTPHVTYRLGGTAKDLYYATRSTTGGWTTPEPIDLVGDVGLGSSIAVSRDSLHVAYYHDGNRQLRYATKAIGGPSWRTALVDGFGAQVGLDCALALDRDATPHIVYHDLTNARLKHAWWTAMGWFQESVYAGAAGTGRSADIAIDERGGLHVSFVVASGESVFCATREDGTWRVELVDHGDPGSVLGQTSIALDGDGRPHISYFMNGYELRHAVRLNGGWVIEEVSEPSTPAWELAYDGFHNSLAIDSQGAARIAYTRYFLDFDPSFLIDYDLRYASSAIELLAPAHAVDWPVGARRQVAWEGTGPVDVFLSTDGGFSYGLLADDVRGGQYRLTVPALISDQCKIKIERAIPHSVSVIDSFFTISSQVALMTFSAAPPADGSRGLELRWATSPGPEDLAGYRLERRVMAGPWRTLVASTHESSWIDRDGAAGSSYRLLATNGLGDELLLGETTFGRVSPVAAWPLPLREGALHVAFATHGGLGGGAGEASVEVYDLAGRLVRTVARGHYQAGLQQVTWDGADSKGARVAEGVYFVRAVSAGQSQTIKIVVAQ